MATDTIPVLESTLRNETGTRAAKQLRSEGKIPAVIYGHKEGNVPVSVSRRDLTQLLHENAQLIDVKSEGKTDHCLIKEVQWNYLGTEIIHVDLTRVDLNEKVTVSVGIELKGDPKALQEEGAYLDHPTTEIDVECLATNIPDHILVNIAELGIGDSISVEDITMPEGVEAVSDPETVIAAIHVAAEEPEEEEEVDADAEPEVIGAKPDEEAGDEGEEGEDK